MARNGPLGLTNIKCFDKLESAILYSIKVCFIVSDKHRNLTHTMDLIKLLLLNSLLNLKYMYSGLKFEIHITRDCRFVPSRDPGV